MSFFLYDNFDKYDDWDAKLVDTCQKFYDKFERYPNYVRMNEKTLDALFNEVENAVKKTKGHVIVPEGRIVECQMPEEEDYGEVPVDDYMEIDEFEEDEDFWGDVDLSGDNIYPKSFGVNDDCTVSFVTNKFELKFLDGEKLPEKCFIIQFGSGPDDGGEDFECETEETEGKMQIFQLAA